MVSGNLELLWAHANLVVAFRLSLFKFFSSVELLASAAEVLLHEVDVVAVVLLLSSWVFHNKDSVFVEGICYLLAEILDFWAFGVLVHEFLKVHNWDVFDSLNLVR